MASVMIVDADRLHETPKAFQQYVARYFRDDVLFGKRVFVAVRFLNLSFWQHNRRGFAPRHMLELSEFKEGLRPGQNLGEWIAKAGKYVWEFEAGFDSDNVTNVD